MLPALFCTNYCWKICVYSHRFYSQHQKHKLKNFITLLNSSFKRSLVSLVLSIANENMIWNQSEFNLNFQVL